MRREKGFSLIEILIVVAVIAIIAAIAIPALRKARQSANAASAIQSLRTISTAQHLYYLKFKTYGTLAALMPEGTLDPKLTSGSKSAYLFAITVDLAAKTWYSTATPEEEAINTRHFFVDETAVIRSKLGSPADATSTPIPQ